MGEKWFTALVIFILVSTQVYAQTSVLPFKSTWKYLDDGSNQGTAWSGNLYNDSNWKTGQAQLGYGDGDESTIISYGPDPNYKHITTYFRNTVSITNLANYTEFTASLLRDDGAVIYVNGIEVYRSNLPTGTITYLTKATTCTDDGKTAQTFKIAPSVLINGENVIAVEIHQDGRSTSDVSFDMKLEGTEKLSDQTSPSILSINRYSPSTTTTSATSLVYRCTFSEGVSGVDALDFNVTRVSGSVNGTLNSDAVNSVNSNGTTYDVTVSSITGEGDIRLDLKSAGTGITDNVGNLINGGFTNGETYTIAAQTSYGGFTTITDINSLPIHTNTEDKPQSKVWTYNGSWWAVLPVPSGGTHLWRLDGTTWTKTLKLSSSSNTKADCKVVGNVTHILLYRGSSTPSQLVSVEHLPASNTYQLWSKQSSAVSITLDPGVETATIDIDGAGRMWVASDGTSDINVRWSDFPYTIWSVPVTIESGISEDDICAVISMPNSGKIGVLWSNQNRQRFGFKTHEDGSNPTEWSSNEEPASQYALNVGGGIADDHINLAIANNGTLYCAVKTRYGSKYPKIGLMVRRPTGYWDNFYEVSQVEGTTPIVVLNEAIGKLKVIYIPSDSGGDIVYKESDISAISFSSRIILKSGNYLFPTSTKQNYSSNVVVLGFDKATLQAVGVIGTDNLNSVSNSKVKVEKTIDAEELYVYPNPFTTETTLNFTFKEELDYTLSLYDSKGIKVADIKQGRATANRVNAATIKSSMLNAGLYIATLYTKKSKKSIKLVLTR
jgi:hypothetical protein